MSPFVSYTVMRLLLFAGCLLAVIAIGARGIVALLLAAVLSMLLSLILLRTQRDRMAQRVADRVGRRLPPHAGAPSAATERDAAIEDAQDEARRAAGGAAAPGDG